MKKLLLLALLISGMANAQKGQASTERGGDYGEDWIEVAYFNYNGSAYASARSEDVGAGCYINLPSDPTSFASMHKVSNTLIIETTDMATTTYLLAGGTGFAQFSDEINLLYKRNTSGEYRGVPSSDQVISDLNLDQNCLVGDFVSANAPTSGPFRLSDYRVPVSVFSRTTGNIPNRRGNVIQVDGWTRRGNSTHFILTQYNGRYGLSPENLFDTANFGFKVIVYRILTNIGNSYTLEPIWTNFEGDFLARENYYYADAYNATQDTDGDGVIDYSDAFPNDPSETLDSDYDGIGDNSDVLPYVSVSNTNTATLLGEVNVIYQNNLYVEGNIPGGSDENFVIAVSNGSLTVTARRIRVETNPNNGIVTTIFGKGPDTIIAQGTWDQFLQIEGIQDQRVYRITER